MRVDGKESKAYSEMFEDMKYANNRESENSKQIVRKQASKKERKKERNWYIYLERKKERKKDKMQKRTVNWT